MWRNGQKIIPFPSISSVVHCTSWHPQKKLICWNYYKAVLSEEHAFSFLGKYRWKQSTKRLNPKGFLQAHWEEQKANLGDYIVGENASMTWHTIFLYKEHSIPCSWSQNAEFWSSMSSQLACGKGCTLHISFDVLLPLRDPGGISTHYPVQGNVRTTHSQ